MVALLFVFVGVASAEVNSVTPSTNDINKTNGWAHVNEISSDVGEVTLEFVSTRIFYSCFEYRTDGDTTQGTGVNPNPAVVDGLYPYFCENNSNSTHTFYANEYVEIRMVFGAENDERFDWTKFDVIPDIESPITSNVVASPNPAAVNSSVAVTANVDDTTAGGSNVASAQYSLDGTNWYPMDAVSAPFDAISEDVTTSFAAPTVPGIYSLCVRGTDVPGNVGNPECVIFVVYDPSGGFVTGGGWITSQEGAMSLPGPVAVWDQNFSTDASGWFSDGITVDGGVAQLSFPGGQYSLFDGYRDVWPGTYTAEIDVYLDPSWLADQGFDYSVASNGSDGLHQRDFIFHVGTVENYGPIVGKELLVAVDNNAYGDPNPFVLTTRPGGYYVVPTAGWYTLQHVFYDAGGYLAVDFNILDSNGNVVWSDTRSDTSDTIPGEVGGNRYAWFAHIDVAAGIQVDNHQLILDKIPAPEGRATFGFVSKYKKGATVPDGNTEFQFKSGDLNFHSTSYDWLVVNQGGTNAQFKGSGTINGAGDYQFMLWAGDGAPDTFRIKIWDAITEVVIYDNGVNQPIGGGSIVVHKK